MKNNGHSRLVIAVIIGNLLFWVYFWVAFGLAAQPYDPRPLGHVPVDVYSFWGHSIGLTTSAYLYPFMRAARIVQFPSFLCATLLERAVGVTGDRFFMGVSEQGIKLLAIVILSFFQWWLVAVGVGKLILKAPE